MVDTGKGSSFFSSSPSLMFRILVGVTMAALYSVANVAISYRSILSQNNDDAMDFSNAPQRYQGVVSHTLQDQSYDAPIAHHSYDAPIANTNHQPPLWRDDEEADDEVDDGWEQDEEIGGAAAGTIASRRGARTPQETSLWLRDFAPDPVSPDRLADAATRQSQMDFQAIATRWDLPEPEASIPLLKEIQSRGVARDYNPATDILALRHPLKTGGTSFSHMLREIFGEDRVVPGSGASQWWQPKKFQRAIEEHDASNPGDPYWSRMAVLYTHTFLRPTQGGAKNRFLEELRGRVQALQAKRFRLMTIVRRPLDLAASSYYETQCRIGRFANQRHLQGAECPPVNLTDVMHKNIAHFSQKCETELQWKSKHCKKIKNQGGEAVYGHCGSVDVLLDQTENVHNMHFKSLMGDFPRPPELGDDETSIGVNLTPTRKDVSLYTLRDLGGLIDYHPSHKEDFVWFAITERFSESMCLFYYHFEVRPVQEKTSLMKPCRPLTFWTEEQKKKFIDNEDFSYTVWRAANAILDVRMQDMRLQIKARLDAGEKLEDMPYVGPGCYVEP